MKFKTLPSYLFLVSIGLFVLGCGGGKPSVNLGDGSLGNLMWGASQYGFVDRDPDKALVYADKALELYGDEARQIQASLSDFPPTDPPEAAYNYKVLNNVGLVALAKGEVLLQEGDRAGAEASFNMVIQDFGYAQFQDFGEWKDYASVVPRDARGFAKLADVAKLRLADMEAGRD